MQKMNIHFIKYIILSLFITACGNGEKSDAYGSFEATTITVSAKGSGELLKFNIEEGQKLNANTVVGAIDTLQLHLEKLKTQATIEALDGKLQEAAPEVAILLKDRSNLIRERDRTERLFKEKAATAKQLDDYNGKIDLINQQINSTRRNVGVANRAVLSERKPLQAQVALINQQINDHIISNPISGTVLTKFVEPNELVNQGAPLYKIANLDELTLKAYTSANLLQDVKLNDTVKVLIDDDKDGYKELSGTISWIASEAEFTPKTIETKEERVNLVYAIEVKVKNNGTLKIGMPGEIEFNHKEE
ncbi:HlyD family efflux transporter periplasmic adaptor subunit [uncultured Aquimarina sp.]|uniref:HlyD family secretion protein n=1 Tax=uncultured Aquimarina sp. TaxID=575652 RepID=UPI00263937BA|nr:HlyD family efflux transporter periplasmic adaptor subunit [uncultured Aquimarina sp.]